MHMTLSLELDEAILDGAAHTLGQTLESTQTSAEFLTEQLTAYLNDCYKQYVVGEAIRIAEQDATLTINNS